MKSTFGSNQRPRRQSPWSVPFFLAALTVHGLGFLFFDEVAPLIFPSPDPDAFLEIRPRKVSIAVVAPDEELTPPPEEIEPEVDLDGQIVEVAPPEEEKRPVDADYLAEHDNAVEEETRSEKFQVNPDILAKQYSEEQKMEAEDILDMNVEKPSTGATVGDHRFDPTRDGSVAAVPSPWDMTNKEGTADPVKSSQSESEIAGAPSNDRLNEKVGAGTNLNTKEFLYANYFNKIKSMVNFYWQQNIQNKPANVAIVKPEYTSTVSVVLNSDGGLEHIEVIGESGVVFLDEAVVAAFRTAAPFPPPPEGLVQKDGRAYLGDMGFTVQFGAARAQYNGVDPRAGVQFPGILKSPR